MMKIKGRILLKTTFWCPHDTIIRSKFNIQHITRTTDTTRKLILTMAFHHRNERSVVLIQWQTFFMNNRRVWLWVLLSVLSWSKPSCVVLKNKLTSVTNLPSYYRCYLDDTLTVMKDEVSAYSFLHVLNDLHPSISFTVELSPENTLPSLGKVLRKDSQNIVTSVCVKPANTGLLLNYNSDVDNRYKKSLILLPW